MRRQARLGVDHPDTLTTMNNLASAYWTAKQLDHAVPLFEATLKLSKAKLGPEHPRVLGTMFNLAVNYRDAGRLKEALALFEETLNLQKAKLGSNDYRTLMTTEYLASAQESVGRWERAELLRRELLAAQRRRLPADDPSLAGTLATLSLNLLRQQKPADAEPLLSECLAIRAKKEPDAWTTFNTKSMLGGALLGQKKYADAEPLLRAGYEGLKERAATILPEGKVRVTEDIQRLLGL